MSIQKFKSRKEVSSFLKEKGIDTSNWPEEKWLYINKGQAEIHMMALAEAMYDAYQESTPKELKAGEWHIPFDDDMNHIQFGKDNSFNEGAIKIATARCARVSYTVVGEEDKPANYENDIKLHDMLAKSGHWSPFEHCAKVMSEEEYLSHVKTFHADGFTFDSHDALYVDTILPKSDFGWCNNFKGFIQYRELINKK